jgi:hypothetical protein
MVEELMDYKKCSGAIDEGKYCLAENRFIFANSFNLLKVLLKRDSGGTKFGNRVSGKSGF